MKKTFIFVALTLFSACQHRDFVWASELNEVKIESRKLIILPGDEVEITFWKHTELNTKEIVDEDGLISVMFTGPIKIAGKTKEEAEEKIKQQLSGFIVDPNLSLKIAKPRPIFASVIGEVKNPGRFSINANETIFHLLARAGGLTDYADPDSIYIIRNKQSLRRIRFKYNDLSSGKTESVFFQIEDGDILYAE